MRFHSCVKQSFSLKNLSIAIRRVAPLRVSCKSRVLLSIQIERTSEKWKKLNWKYTWAKKRISRWQNAQHADMITARQRGWINANVAMKMKKQLANAKRSNNASNFSMPLHTNQTTLKFYVRLNLPSFKFSERRNNGKSRFNRAMKWNANEELFKPRQIEKNGGKINSETENSQNGNAFCCSNSNWLTFTLWK